MNLTKEELKTLVELISDAIDVGVREWPIGDASNGGGKAYEETICHLRTILDKVAAFNLERQWRVVVPTPTADEPERIFEFEVIEIDHENREITVSAYSKAEAGGVCDSKKS